MARRVRCRGWTQHLHPTHEEQLCPDLPQQRTVAWPEVVDYQPLEPNVYDIHRITTRIKAEEQLWNKVVDEIVELDRLVQPVKKLRHLSRYVKDVFGLKIVVGEAEQIPLFGFYQALLRWLFLDPSTPPPRYPGLRLSVAD